MMKLMRCLRTWGSEIRLKNLPMRLSEVGRLWLIPLIARSLISHLVTKKKTGSTHWGIHTYLARLDPDYRSIKRRDKGMTSTTF